MSSNVRNLLINGKLIKRGKYLPHISVMVYSDGNVVLTDDGDVYDGDMDNLVAFCKERGAKLVNTLPPVAPSKPMKDATELPLAPRGVVGSDHVSHPIQDDAHEPPANVYPNVAGVTEKIDLPVYTPVIPQPPVNGVGEGKAATPRSGRPAGGYVDPVKEHTHQITIRNAVLRELVIAASVGRKPQHKQIHEFMNVHGLVKHPPPAIDAGRKVGSLEELFNRISSEPDERLFTEPVESLFPNKRDMEIELAAADELYSILTG